MCLITSHVISKPAWLYFRLETSQRKSYYDSKNWSSPVAKYSEQLDVRKEAAQFFSVVEVRIQWCFQLTLKLNPKIALLFPINEFHKKHILRN